MPTDRKTHVSVQFSENTPRIQQVRIQQVRRILCRRGCGACPSARLFAGLRISAGTYVTCISPQGSGPPFLRVPTTPLVDAGHCFSALLQSYSKVNTETHLWKASGFRAMSSFAWNDSAASGSKIRGRFCAGLLLDEAFARQMGDPATYHARTNSVLAVKKRSNSLANLTLADSTRSVEVAAATNLSGGAGCHSGNV